MSKEEKITTKSLRASFHAQIFIIICVAILIYSAAATFQEHFVDEFFKKILFCAYTYIILSFLRTYTLILHKYRSPYLTKRINRLKVRMREHVNNSELAEKARSHITSGNENEALWGECLKENNQQAERLKEDIEILEQNVRFLSTQLEKNLFQYLTCLIYRIFIEKKF